MSDMKSTFKTSLAFKYTNDEIVKKEIMLIPFVIVAKQNKAK
jgi:hypothetical protein